MNRSIVIFGVNGVGKSTIAERLKELFKDVEIAHGSDLLISELFNVSLEQVVQLSKEERGNYYKQMEKETPQKKKEAYLKAVKKLFERQENDKNLVVLETHLVAYSPYNGFELMWDASLDGLIDEAFLLDTDISTIHERRAEDNSRERVLNEELLKQHCELNRMEFNNIKCDRMIIDASRSPEIIAEELHDIMSEPNAEIINK